MSNLFENIPSSSSEDYVALVEQPQKASLRDIAQNLWENFEPYADSDFRSDFSVHIHQRFWEMYLGAWFLRNGYQLIKRNSKAGPDIQICHKGQTIWIEASAPCEGQGQDAVPPITESRPFEPIPEDKIILRFTGAVSSKTFSRENYISQGFVSSFDPYVIAINGRGIPMTLFDGPLPAIIKAVYPFGDYSVTLHVETLETVSQGYQRRTEIMKNSGSPIPTTAFLSPETSGISGILYSNAALWDYPSTPGDELLYIHNSTATNPLPRGFIKAGRECFLQAESLVITDHSCGG